MAWDNAYYEKNKEAMREKARKYRAKKKEQASTCTTELEKRLLADTCEMCVRFHGMRNELYLISEVA